MVSQRLILLISTFLASTTSTTSAFQANAVQAPAYPSQLGYMPDRDALQSPPTPAFEQTVRNLVIKQEDPNASQSQSGKGLPNMMSLSTRKEFKAYVKDQGEKMTVVRFHAPFCKACKAMQPAWERLARTHPEINFVNVAYNKQNVETRALVSQLRVNKIPFGQVYHPAAGLVESANFNKKHFGNVVKHIEWYITGQCGLEEEVDENSQVYESPYMNLAV